LNTVGAQAIAAEFVGTFKEFPPRQKPQNFNLDQILAHMQKPNDD
jgi:arylsulfatase